MGSIWKFSPKWGGGGGEGQLNFDASTKTDSFIVLTFISLTLNLDRTGL